MEKTTQASKPGRCASGNQPQAGAKSQEMNNVSAPEAQDLTLAEKIDSEVRILSDGILDDFGTTWKLEAMHFKDSHYIRYMAKINGESVIITGPHESGRYNAFTYWSAGTELLGVLGSYGLSNADETDLDAAISWVHHAQELAEAAVNRHVNQARTAAAVRKLEKQRDDSIADLNQKFDRQVAEIQQKAGLAA
jgi:hypothetical protein